MENKNWATRIKQTITNALETERSGLGRKVKLTEAMVSKLRKNLYDVDPLSSAQKIAENDPDFYLDWLAQKQKVYKYKEDDVSVEEDEDTRRNKLESALQRLGGEDEDSQGSLFQITDYFSKKKHDQRFRDSSHSYGDVTRGPRRRKFVQDEDDSSVIKPIRRSKQTRLFANEKRNVSRFVDGRGQGDKNFSKR